MGKIAEPTANTTSIAIAGENPSGNAENVKVDASGNLVASGAETKTDDSVFTVATDKGYPIAALADETGSDSVDEGDIGVLRMTLSRFLKTSLGDLISGEDQTNNVLATVQKPVAVSTYVFDKDVSAALEASSISKATAGNLFRAFGVIDSTTATGTYYIQFLDSATLPANGAVNHIISPIPIAHVNGTNSTFDTGHIDCGAAGANGIVICASTTMVTKTIAGSIMFATVLYK